MPFVPHGAQERRQQLAHVLGAHPRVVGQPAGHAQRIEPLASSTTSAGVAVGPIFTPIGLWTPEKNSTCAPSSWRVRSPIQSMCAEQSYQSPVIESRRVRPSS